MPVGCLRLCVSGLLSGAQRGWGLLEILGDTVLMLLSSVGAEGGIQHPPKLWIGLSQA